MSLDDDISTSGYHALSCSVWFHGRYNQNDIFVPSPTTAEMANKLDKFTVFCSMMVNDVKSRLLVFNDDSCLSIFRSFLSVTQYHLIEAFSTTTNQLYHKDMLYWYCNGILDWCRPALIQTPVVAVSPSLSRRSNALGDHSFIEAETQS